MYQELESRFNVIYPTSDNATYSSLMNYSDDLKKPLQRWYRYKEGFSIELIKNLINEYNKNTEGIIMDPFLGSGTTLLTANMLGLKGIGYEVNPFSFFLSKCKLRNYKDLCIKEFDNKYMELTQKALLNIVDYKLPQLSIANKTFEKHIEEYMLTLKSLIEGSNYDYTETKDLLVLGWLACIEELSIYRKAGNGLKKRKYVKPRLITKEDVFKLITETYNNIKIDVSTNVIDFNVSLYNKSCLSMADDIKGKSVSGIIFSPPYANCFDYTEIYKLELWFGGFVSEYKDLKVLRNLSLRSHLNGDLSSAVKEKSTKSLDDLLKELESKELWDKKIPTMLKLYFHDMFTIIENAYKVLEDNGFCCIVVGNSSYGNIIFPTDLLLAEYAEIIGFYVDKIEVDRYLITSSQQYETTEKNKRYLRESVVCLIKK